MRYLQHKKNGRKFAYTEILATHPDLEEVGTDTAPAKAPKPAETKAPEPDRQEKKEPDVIVLERGTVRLDDATKDELDQYAQRHFGAKLNLRKGLPGVADQVRELVKTHGHPDFD